MLCTTRPLSGGPCQYLRPLVESGYSPSRPIELCSVGSLHETEDEATNNTTHLNI
jgi:hypothetical protein